MCATSNDSDKEHCAIALVLPGAAAAHSGILADKLQGVLRSPTFTVTQPRIFYRLWGTGGRLRLVIDGLQLIQDPIYGGLDFAPRAAQPYWHEQEVSKWIGHRAYIELVDHGDGHIALDRAVMADRPPPEVVNRLLLKRLADPAITSLEALAAAYQELFVEATARFAAGTLDEDGLGAERVQLVHLLLSHELCREATLNDAAAQATAERRATIAALEEKRNALCANLPPPRRALAIAEGTPEDEHLFIRGNHRTAGDEVPRRPLCVFAGEERPAPSDRSGRLELAQSLVDGSNPLVPRVIVNRLWQYRFGRGIVPTTDDFGAMGQPPTHPELLDWLAAELIEQGWSLKSLDRLMVLSSTYRMSGAASNDAVAADPTNRLVHHMPRRRLDAESIRDAVLAVSGRLDRAMFGPGVAPHLTPFMNGRGRPKESGPLDGAGRRSIYINVRRNFLTPMLLAFDYPTPFTTIGRRSASNVPAQALTMLNNPFVAEQAAVWARRILSAEGLTDDQRATAMYVEAFGRRPDAEELAAVAAFLIEQRTGYAAADEQRVWTDLAHVLFNAKEFIFVE
ncbi:MAG: DUF1553 domain-containing protein [Planctomycetia bacterium]|nr:DUF1553 domain-containing protein [Planctomycetia bacterium]